MTKAKLPDRLLQPIDDKDAWCFILRPAAFFWTAGRLYVGYARLSCLHHDEEPLWDPTPVPQGVIIETCAGFYQLTGVLIEGAPYRRQYAQLQFAHLYRPDDYGSGFLRKQIDQGAFPIREQYVLAPNTYLEAQWLSDALLHKSRRDGRNFERKILRHESLTAMRQVEPALRKQMEDLFGTVADREKMIRRFAAKSLSGRIQP
jgi:hypothetical protein